MKKETKMNYGNKFRYLRIIINKINMIIAISWVDNTGKSSLIQELTNILRKEGRKVKILEEIARKHIEVKHFAEKQDLISIDEEERFLKLLSYNKEDILLIDRTISDNVFFNNYWVICGEKWEFKEDYMPMTYKTPYRKVFLITKRVKETDKYYFTNEDFRKKFNQYIINKYNPICIDEKDLQKRINLILKHIKDEI